MLPVTIFKAYDIRGVYPSEINEKVVAEIIPKILKFFSKTQKLKSKSSLIIGHDVRISSLVLYKTVLKSLNTQHCDPIPVGLITTPMLYFLVNKNKAFGGIIITASHNPKQFNGLKIVGPKAVPISGKEILEIINSQ